MGKVARVNFRERDQADLDARGFSDEVACQIGDQIITAFAGMVITEDGEVHTMVSPGEDFARLMGAIEMLKEEMHESVR